MATTLSNGVVLESLSPADLAALVSAANNLFKRAPRPKTAREPIPAARCVISPHTHACTRCGAPAGASKCDSALVSVQYVATLAMRAAR